MKFSLFGILVLASCSAFALPEKNVATCTLQDDSKEQIGTMNVFASDNGDEGFLRFDYVLKTDPGGEFTDNVQDDGAVFLQSGNQALYVPIEGSKSHGKGSLNGVAVYLVNDGKSITGLLKADFLKANLNCTKAK